MADKPVHPGSFCVLGTTGQTANGTPMVCAVKTEGSGERPRWRRDPDSPAPARTPRPRRRAAPITAAAVQAAITQPTLPEPAPPTLADQIMNAYRQMANRPGGYVRLANLRVCFPTVARTDLDAALVGLDDERRIQLEPDPDRGGLTAADHAAAVHLIGRALHLMRAGSGQSTLSEPTPEVSVPTPSPADLILRGINDRTWTRLTDLRPATGLDPAVFDATMLDLHRTGRIRLEADPFRWRITAEETAAAIRLGGEDRHLTQRGN